MPGEDYRKDVNNVNGHGTKDEIRQIQDSSRNHFQRSDNTTPLLQQEHTYQQYRLAERANGTSQNQQSDERVTSRPSPERYKHSDQRPSSPTSDRGGDINRATKPMVLLQNPSATSLSSVGSTLPTPGGHPVLPTAAMHHPIPPFLYPMIYPAGAAIDPALAGLNRGPGGAAKEGEVHVSSPNGSPSATLSAVSAPMQLQAQGFMYPFSNQAFMMGARSAGGIADISPFLLAQSAYAGAGLSPNLAMIDQYKRLLEGIPQFPSAYNLQPHLADQYLKSLMPQGIEGAKDPLSLAALGNRVPHGMSLAGLQGQPGAWYPEHLSAAAAAAIRPHDGMSPRSASPYANKRRSESPVPNGTKPPIPGYPYHGSLTQTLGNLNESRVHARSPANFSHGQRSRSPHPEVRKPEMERMGFPSHSRDSDRDKPLTRELPSSSVSASHQRNNVDHPSNQLFSITDERGRKIAMPQFYSAGSVPTGYPHNMPVHPRGHERSPSPQSRTSDDLRAFRRASRERSPGGDHLPNKRRSLDSQYVARHSPITADRHNSRPTSPTTNGQIPTTRHQHSLVNGNAEAAAELIKASPHLLLPMGHRGSPNPPGNLMDARDPTNGSPSANPYLTSTMSPYFGQALTPLFLSPQYAQAIAMAGKGPELNASLASLYKANENNPEYQRIPLGMAALHLLPQQQQQLLASAARPDYAAALKAHSYFAQAQAAKETGKASPMNGREKHPGLSQPTHHMLQQPGPALSPANKSKHSSSPMQNYIGAKGGPQHVRLPDSHSPIPNANLNNNILSTPEGRRYLSPQSAAMKDRQVRENSPKPSNKHYRPISMLHHHAEDLAEHRNRKRKLEDEIAMGEEASNFRQGKQHLQRPEIREKLPPQNKDVKKDPKRRKPVISDESNADIEEHFRRSLGPDYKVPDTSNKVSITGSVDDHFKKALGGEIWNKLQTTASVPIKTETRDVAPHTTHVLPSYSAAVSGTPSFARGYPYLDGKQNLPRVYEQYPPPKDRYYIQNMANIANHHRRPTKSPPEAARHVATTGPTVLYPSPSQPVAPARQRIKAKGVVFPESPSVLPDMTSRAARASSLGSKGSTRTISGSSGESGPKGTPSPTPLQPPSTTANSYPDSPHSQVPSTIQPPISYPYGHLPPSTAPSTSIPGVAPSPGSHPHSIKSSSSSSSLHRDSPSLNPGAEETSRGSPGPHFTAKETAVPEPSEGQSKENGKLST